MTKLGANPGHIYTDRDVASSIQSSVNRTPGLGDADTRTLSVNDVKAFMTRFKADANFRDAFHESHFGYDGVPEFVIEKAAGRIMDDIPEAMDRNAVEVLFAKVSALMPRLGFLQR